MKDSTKTYSSKQEKMVADLLGWNIVAGSGAAACFPGDVISDEWLGECKTHTEPGHKIFFSKAVWDKIKQEAMVKKRFPVLFTDDGTQIDRHTWCLCMCDRLEMEDVHFEPITKGINKNISYNHDSLYKSAKDICVANPGKYPVFYTQWHEDKIAICQLSVFVMLVGE